MRLIAQIDDLRKQMRRATEAGAAAIRFGVNEATESLKMRLRFQTRAAGLGNRVSYTWRSKTKPSGPSYDADGMVWSKAPHILRSHGFGATIVPIRGSRFLAIALPAAGKGPRGARITPAQWQRRTGTKLVFVKTRRGEALLVADRVIGFRKTGAARISKAKKPRNATIEPIFVLKPMVRLPKRMNIIGAARAEIKLLPGYIANRWRKAV